MMWSLYSKLLYDKRWFVLGWSFTFAAVTLLIIATFHSFDEGSIDTIASQLPEQLKGLIGDTTALNRIDSYLASQLYDIRLPLLVMIMALILASSLTLNEEERGLTKTLLTTPLSRPRIIAEKWLAAATIIAAVILTSVITSWIGLFAIDEYVKPQLLWEFAAALWVLGMTAFAITFGAGLATGKRSLTMTLGLIVVAGSFIVSTMARAVESLEIVDTFSLLHYFHPEDIIKDSVQINDYLVLCGITLVFVVVGIVGFSGRDITGE